MSLSLIGRLARIAAIIVYLYVEQFVSKTRTPAALAELFGTPDSSGTVANVTARAARRLGEFLDRVRTRLAASEVVGVDNTGCGVTAGCTGCIARTGKHTPWFQYLTSYHRYASPTGGKSEVGS